MATPYPRTYPGTRWQIVFGSYAGIEEFAVNELQRLVQDYQPYVIELHAADRFKQTHDSHLILVGTRQNNRWLDDLAQRQRLDIPDLPEHFLVASLAAGWKPEQRVIVIAGADAKGVLNGVAEFGAGLPGHYAPVEYEHRRREIFDALPAFTSVGRPAVTNRGIWTWGYCIYDYRRFLDNMARLKMNMLVMWNDCAPANLRQVVAYAHARGIRVIAGFPWGWGHDDLALDNPKHRAAIRTEVLRHYADQYSHTAIDGIYFQTLTEHREMNRQGKSTAACACVLVNEISRALWKRYPKLYIQFGLHATSIMENYRDLATLDPRLALIWEDAGVSPYSYQPMLTSPADSHAALHGVGDGDGTIAFSKRLAGFRGKSEFGLCSKGFSTLNWAKEFEHHGPFILGERSATQVARRYGQRTAWRQACDQQWIECYPHAARFYREVQQAVAGPMTAVALVEDGLFEQAIPLSVALFAETVWNPERPDAALLRAAMTPYFRNGAGG